MPKGHINLDHLRAGGGAATEQSIKSHDADTLKRATVTKTHGTGSYLQPQQTNQSKSHTNDSLLKAARITSHGTDSLLEATLSKSCTTNTTLKITQTRSSTTNSYLRSTRTCIYNTSSQLRSSTIRLSISDSSLRSTSTLSNSTRSLLRNTKSYNHNSDNLLRLTTIRSSDTGVFLQAAASSIHLNDSYLRDTSQVVNYTNIILRSVVTRTHTSSIYLRTTRAINSNSDAFKRLSQPLVSYTDVRIGSPSAGLLSVGSRSRTQRIGTRSSAFGDNSMKERQRNTSNYPISVLMISSSDHVTGTGSVTATIVISKNGGPWVAPAGSLVYDTYGWFEWTPDIYDRDTLGELRIHVTAPGCDPYDEKYEIVAYDPFLGASTQVERDAVADAVLTRDWSNMTIDTASRSVLNALRFVRNRWFVDDSGMLTITKEDNESVAWTMQT